MGFDVRKNLRDRDGEENGTWMEYGDGARFLVARKTNSKYKAFLSKELRNNAKLIDSQVPTPEGEIVSSRILVEATSKYLLRDWDGVTSDGKAVKYTPELGMQVIEEHEDLKEAIEAYADLRENYIAEQEQKDAKNLKK